MTNNNPLPFAESPKHPTLEDVTRDRGDFVAHEKLALAVVAHLIMRGYAVKRLYRDDNLGVLVDEIAGAIAEALPRVDWFELDQVRWAVADEEGYPPMNPHMTVLRARMSHR